MTYRGFLVLVCSVILMLGVIGFALIYDKLLGIESEIKKKR